MKIFFLISIAWSASIPLVFDDAISSSVISMSVADGQPIRFRPYLGSLSIMYGFAESPADRQLFIHRVIGQVGRFHGSFARIVIQNMAFRFIHSNAARRLRQSWIGIGPQSDIVTQHTSVDFLKGSNGYRLELGSPRQTFIDDNCLENSFIQIGVLGQNMTATFDAFFLQRQRSIIFSPIEYVLSIAPEDFVDLFGDVLDMITRDNGFDRPMRIEHCSHHLQMFPNVTIDFQHAGNLSLVPADYTRRTSDDFCELLVEIDSRPENVAVYMNPLLIEDMNLRITNDEILICDSI